MSRPEWIVCERSPYWIAGLRKALQREAAAMKAFPRLREVRSLSEAESLLEKRPDCFLLIEVHRDNLSAVLKFLSEAEDRCVHACIAALIDPTIASNLAERQIITDVLLEAGAGLVMDTPRRLGGILRLSQRHTAKVTETAGAFHRNASVVEHAWLSLPWQE